MQAVIYARQSSGDEDDSLSIEAQIDACKALAKRERLTIEGVYSDYNTSGTTYPIGSEAFAKLDTEWVDYCKENAHVAKRPYRKGLAEALKHLPQGGYVLVSDSTRFARPLSNSFLSNHLVKLLKAKGAIVWSTTEGKQDYLKADTKLIATIREQIEAESKEKRRKASIEGKKRRKDRGLSQGGIPYGYKLAKPGLYEPVTSEAATIKRIFMEYAAGKGTSAIGRDLAHEGFKSRCVKPLTEPFISKLLRKPFYMGMLENSAGELIDTSSFPAIVDKAIWFKAKKRIDNCKSFQIHESKQTHYLNGLLFCGCCERSMTINGGNVKKAGMVYSCIRHTRRLFERRKEGCRKSYCVEHRGFYELGQLPENFRCFGLAEALYPLAIVGSYKAAQKNVSDSSGIERKISLTNESSRLKRKLDELQKLWMADALTISSYESMAKDLKKQLRVTEEELGVLRNLEDEERERVESDWETLYEQIKIGILPLTQLSDLLHAVIRKVMVHPYAVDVYLFDDSVFTLPRIPFKSARCFPAWRLSTATLHRRQNEQGEPWQIRGIKYYYPSAYKGDTKVTELYKSKYLVIDAIGAIPERKARK